MNVSSARLVRVLLIAFLMTPAQLALASGSGGFSDRTTMPSQSVPKFDAAAEYRKGIDSLKAGQYADAEHSFSLVLDSNPRDANTHFMMGLAQGGQAKLADARGHFERAIKYNDALIPAHMELGVTLAKLGETDKAKAILEDMHKRATACADTCPQAKDLQSAISTLDSVLTPPASPASSASPATSQIPSNQELLPASIASGDRAYLDAVSLINEKRYQDAIAALDRSARVFGPHPDILTYLGYANRKLGRYDVAQDYDLQALAAAPDHLGATEYYGELMVERGDIAGAKRMLVKLDTVCHFGCAQADELRRWIVAGKEPSS